jgi:hypothetical protein
MTPIPTIACGEHGAIDPSEIGIHAALFGVNPWRLQAWMGHQRIDETMLYVHVAENHRARYPRGHRVGRPSRDGPGSPGPADARRSWQPRGSEWGTCGGNFND